MATIALSVEAIRIDGGTQMRAELSEATVAEYAENIKALPPVTVFFDGSEYWLADGFHRYHAHRQAGRAKIGCVVQEGTLRDAILHAVGSNIQHGLRRKNPDKRRAVEALLNDQEWVLWSDSVIADKAGVSQPFVLSVRSELISVIGSPAAEAASKPRKGKDGKSRKPPKKKAKSASLFICQECGTQYKDATECAACAAKESSQELPDDSVVAGLCPYASLTEAIEALNTAVSAVYLRWPQEYAFALSDRLQSLAEELQEKGSLRC